MPPSLSRAQAEKRYARATYLDIRSKGAVSGQDCTAAIDAARAESTHLFFPQGTWLYNGDGIEWDSLFIKGVGRGRSIIGLGAGKSLIVGTGANFRFGLEDVRIDGGFGAIRLTGAGANVGPIGGQNINRVDFYNYTGTAISHQFSDSPQWAIRDSSFFATNDTAAIGIALHGDSAHVIIDNCTFGRNRVHIKIGAGNGGNATKVRNCDFVRNNGYSGNPRTDIWIVPTGSSNPSSLGALFDANKFGPENRGALDDAILVAEEDPDGTDPATSLPSYAVAATTREVRGMRVRNSIFGANQATAFVRSTTTRLPLLDIDGILTYGAAMPYIIEFIDPTTAGFVAGEEVRVAGLLNRDAGHNGVTRLSNAAVPIGWVLDPGSTLDTGRGNLGNLPGGGDRGGYVSTLGMSSTANLTPGGSTTVTGVTDWLGGTDAARVVGAGVAPFAYSGLVGVTAGEPHWVEVDLAPPDAGTPPAEITVEVTTGAGFPDHRMMVRTPSAWRRFRFLHVPRSGSWTQLRMSSTETGTAFRVGRVRSYHGAEPQIDVAGLTAAATTAAIAALGAGSNPWLRDQAASFSPAFTAITTKHAATMLPTAGTIRWPDGTTGAFTATIDSTSTGYASYAMVYGSKTVTASGISYDTDGIQLGPTSIVIT
jgi:hypothetical protein